MCRLYHSHAGDYVRLCASTGLRGEHWGLDRVHSVDPAYAGLGCVRVPRRRVAVGRPRPSRTDTHPGDFCVRCGEPNVPAPDGRTGRGGECFWCTHRHDERAALDTRDG